MCKLKCEYFLRFNSKITAEIPKNWKKHKKKKKNVDHTHTHTQQTNKKKPTHHKQTNPHSHGVHKDKTPSSSLLGCVKTEDDKSC